METYTIDTKIVTDYIVEVWPLTCVYCDSKDLIFSPTKDDVLCNDCGRWQLTEEMNDD